MSIYHSVVVKENGRDGDVEKGLLVIQESNPKTERLGTITRVFLIGSFALLLIFLIASLGDYLYELFGPVPGNEAFDITEKPCIKKSKISLILTNRFTIQIIAVILLIILGKIFWDENK